MLLWFRRKFITGFFVTVPLIISTAAIIWIFDVIDGFMVPIYREWIGREIPGLGIVATAAFILLIGVLASNVMGKRLVQRGESYLLRVPVFKTVYSPVKQLIVAFSPDNEYGFKRVVLIRQGAHQQVGFLTKEFTVEAGADREALIAVYVPTNHLYLGDILIVPRDAVSFPDITVEEGIRIILTGGMSMPDRVRGRRLEDPIQRYRAH
jgi:uncharacterized membrane protein